MHDVWNGAAESQYEGFGGLKNLWSNKHYRALYAERQKKAIRRLQFINKFFDYQFSQGKTFEQIVKEVEDAFKETNKTEITLSGTEIVLRKKLHWAGKP